MVKQMRIVSIQEKTQEKDGNCFQDQYVEVRRKILGQYKKKLCN